jgi:Ca2+-binding RTX toxin-like protein
MSVTPPASGVLKRIARQYRHVASGTRKPCWRNSRSTRAWRDRELSRGAGDDLLEGYNGADVIRGGRGNDLLLGQRGEDDLRGGSGNDRLSGGRENEMLRGGPGRDRLSGNGGADVLYARDRNRDSVSGGGHDRARVDSIDELFSIAVLF